jgi:signal transduction histidine kinase/DNA-binding NarL/FixJ family response regulator/HPt (histidine-containing phosphotransfer) domain-containing protein
VRPAAQAGKERSMQPMQRLSIKTKLILFSMISVAVALALSAVGITVNEVYRMRSFKMEAIDAQAGMLGFNSTGVLTFNDVPAATQLLASLKSEPTVEFACLYDSAGRLVAKYPAESREGVPISPPASDARRFNDRGQVEVFRRIVDHDEHVGGLYLRATADDLHRQLMAYVKIVAIVVLAALAVSMPLAAQLQSSISGPILRLAEAATRVSSLGDYTIRVHEKSEDELGVLCTEFNRMLDRVDASDTALKNANEALTKAHDGLEERVVERTAELREEIAAREKTQSELLKAKEAAEAANVAKSQFLANMSHEIRTPLNAVIGFTDLLIKGGDQCDDAERRDYLDTIHTSAKHLLSLINDILDLSKIEADRLEIERIPCSPHALLGEIISVLRVKALEKSLALGYRWQSGVPETIRTDPSRLRQLLMNLVGNAIKFTPQGSVEIVAELVCDDGDPRLAIQVIDTGVGIPREKFGTIFDPFVQADTSVTRQFGGTGLGLTISRRIAQALGGDIAVSSEVGKGSTFTVTLATGPLDGVRILDAPEADAMRSRKETAGTAFPSLAGARILVVEDGVTNRKLIGLILRKAGVEVAMAENGRIGADLAMQSRFDLILMDMQMPVMDGYTAATFLRQHGIDTPIIALTAHAMKGDQDKCLAAGCTAYVTKPIDADHLLRSVGEALGTAWQPTQRVAVAGTSVPPESAPPEGTVCPEPLAGTVAREPRPPVVSTLPTDDPDFREIVEEFIERLQTQLMAMQRAFEGDDLPEVSRLAHWLKGAGGTAGFAAFTEPSKRLESLVRDRQCKEIEGAIGELLDLARRVQARADVARV